MGFKQDRGWDEMHGVVDEPSSFKASFSLGDSIDHSTESYLLPNLDIDVQWSTHDWTLTWDGLPPHYLQLAETLDALHGSAFLERLATLTAASPVMIFAATAFNLGCALEWNNLTKYLHPDSAIALAGK
jgi:hypothetical protein